MGQFAGFQKVKLTKPQRSTFDLTHDKRITTRMGILTPCLITECVPSDMFNGSSEMLVRMAPLLAPIFDQIECYVHFYFVPNRLIWEDWEEFITGGRLGVGVDPVTAPVPPSIEIDDIMSPDPGFLQEGSLADYLGVPDLVDINSSSAAWNNLRLDMMPFGAYQLVWSNYYRDRNFIADTFEELFPLPSGQLTYATYRDLFQLRLRNYKHDYFTSALPFTQRGEEVLIPLDGAVNYFQQSFVVNSADGSNVNNNDLVLTPNDATSFGTGTLGAQNAPNTEGLPIRIENIDSISNISTTINDFRSAYALQVWLERNAVGGSRYTESTQAHFGVRPQDSRLQRPEYIGGGRIPVRISEVLATSWSQDSEASSVPQGNMAGHGVTYGYTNNFKYFCSEHGFIIGILSIMNPPSYHQGMPRMFRRRSFLDYPWPTFAKLGEQTVDQAELYSSPAALTPGSDGTLPLFGYQSRYADWKWIKNSNHGAFHDNMLFWTLTRDFNAVPPLNENFSLFDITTEQRIFASADVISDPGFWIYAHNRMFVKRPLPYFGTPNTLGFV